MKKIVLFLLMVLNIATFINIINYGAVESIFYDYEVVDNYHYELKNGGFIYDSDYFVSSRIVLKSNTLSFNNLNFNHLALFDSWNNYLGYYNVLNTNTYEFSSFKGYITGDDLVLDSSVKKVAIIGVKSGGAYSPLNNPILELNNYSLYEVFNDFNLLSNYNTKDKFFDNILDFYYTDNMEYTIYDSTYDYIKFKALKNYTCESTKGYVALELEGDLAHGDLLYIYLNAYSDAYSSSARRRVWMYINNAFLTRSMTTISVTDNNTLFDYIYSNEDDLPYEFIGTSPSITPLSDTENYFVFDMLGDYSYYSGFHIFLEDSSYNITLPYIINMTELGNELISENDIYSYYQDYLDGALSAYDIYYDIDDLGVLSVYYEREEMVSDTSDDAEGYLDSILNDMGYNNAEGKILLAVVILVITVIALALMKAHFSIILFIVIAIFVVFSFIGWLPLWINIILALLALGFLIYKFKGGVGADD
jgi:hypothetical protein